jgi:hypothetical protein
LLNTWDGVNDFALPHHDNDKPLETIPKIPQPVLMRWWYVGVATAYLKQNYPIVLRATQICININDSKSRPNKIASGLQFLMKQGVAYSNMLFLVQFHNDFLTQHFKWLQEEDEFAKTPGFCCRKILVRYYLMRKDLEILQTRMPRNTFGDYDKNLQNLSGETRGGETRGKQKQKSEVLILEAMDNLDEHCLRWCNELLSAAFGGEARLAKIVAQVSSTKPSSA